MWLLIEVCGEQETFDLVGLLLMIRINYHHQLIMNKRRIPCLDDYLDRTNLLLWPRFKVSTPVRQDTCLTVLITFRGISRQLNCPASDLPDKKPPVVVPSFCR